MGSAIGVGKQTPSRYRQLHARRETDCKSVAANIIDPEKDMIEPLRLSLEKADIILTCPHRYRGAT
jgi:hypothetical protein